MTISHATAFLAKVRTVGAIVWRGLARYYYYNNNNNYYYYYNIILQFLYQITVVILYHYYNYQVLTLHTNQIETFSPKGVWKKAKEKNEKSYCYIIILLANTPPQVALDVLQSKNAVAQVILSSYYSLPIG